ncbi:autotransporter-associated beta strand repeat-containing protein [Streptomyces sp. CB01881]|uniref:autotransporter-associated beta strand repeat-containing protein n=1 Tax=Streptomyces sp. CB01881 TaxID=2078691 RepID=UPI000CDC6B63|nr:autotransporter-associated beta strand repeat-containing protein [Streptomyces sp. CB01881]AUY53515.1 autotransporter [Streptomyces sp. CB01881]TYC69662.1 autotransporter [Streptomyces sp. CB01881]
MKRPWHALLASAIVVATTVPVALAPTGAVAADGDITSSILANSDVVLGGNAVVNVPPGAHTYSGVISGQGSLRVSGTGTLILTRDSTFTLPGSQQGQSVSIPGGNHPYVVLSNPDRPAITVDAGATLQYGNGGTTGLIGAFPYNSPGYQQNQDNIRVDGTLNLSLTRLFNLGTISGSGTIVQPRNLWGTLQLCGSSPFSGVLDIGTGANYASTTCAADLPNARAVLNRGSWIIDTPLNQTVVQRQNFYSREYGNDVNVHSRPGSKVVLTGTYSYSDNTSTTSPALSNNNLNWVTVAHRLNKRGTNIEGADVQWGDGTTHQIFMPGTAETAYINLHARSQRSRLTFNYNGPVTLGLPIGGGMYHDTLAAPGGGDIVIAGTRGNDVTFAAAQFYDGSTTIQQGATLRLGSGAAGADGSLYTKGPLDAISNNGSLIIQNVRTPVTLPAVSGSGSVTQDGAATATLTAASYTGATTVAKGTLAVAGAPLSSSSGVALTDASAVLDLGAATSTTLRKLEVVTGAKIILPGGAQSFTVGSQDAALSGDTLSMGGASFSVARTAGRIELTAVTAATETASPSASSTDEPAGQAGDSASTASTAGTAAARAGGAVWETLAAVGAALAAAAGVVLLALRIRRRRGHIGRRRRHGR